MLTSKWRHLDPHTMRRFEWPHAEMVRKEARNPRTPQGAALATANPRTRRNPAQDRRRHPEKARQGGRTHRAKRRGRLQRRRRPERNPFPAALPHATEGGALPGPRSSRVTERFALHGSARPVMFRFDGSDDPQSDLVVGHREVFPVRGGVLHRVEGRRGSASREARGAPRGERVARVRGGGAGSEAGRAGVVAGVREAAAGSCAGDGDPAGAGPARRVRAPSGIRPDLFGAEVRIAGGVAADGAPSPGRPFGGAGT